MTEEVLSYYQTTVQCEREVSELVIFKKKSCSFNPIIQLLLEFLGYTFVAFSGKEIETRALFFQECVPPKEQFYQLISLL